MPLVGAVAAPHSHLQLFTRPSEDDDYKRKVQLGREAMFVLKEQVDKSGADTILIIHDDHFVNFDFRCYPQFALFVGSEAGGSGVMHPEEIERITGATYRRYAGKNDYSSAPKGIPQHLAAWEQDRPYIYDVASELSAHILKQLIHRDFDIAVTQNGLMDGELVLTTNFLNPKADKSIVLMLTNGYVPPVPRPERCFHLGQALREIIDKVDNKVVVLATGGMSHYPGTPLYGHVDEAFDRKILDVFARGDTEALKQLTPDEMVYSGNGELVNWIIAAGMAGHATAKVVEYTRLWHIGLGYIYWEL